MRPRRWTLKTETRPRRSIFPNSRDRDVQPSRPRRDVPKNVSRPPRDRDVQDRDYIPAFLDLHWEKLRSVDPRPIWLLFLLPYSNWRTCSKVLSWKWHNIRDIDAECPVYSCVIASTVNRQQQTINCDSLQQKWAVDKTLHNSASQNNKLSHWKITDCCTLFNDTRCTCVCSSWSLQIWDQNFCYTRTAGDFELQSTGFGTWNLAPNLRKCLQPWNSAN